MWKSSEVVSLSPVAGILFQFLLFSLRTSAVFQSSSSLSLSSSSWWGSFLSLLVRAVICLFDVAGLSWISSGRWSHGNRRLRVVSCFLSLYLAPAVLHIWACLFPFDGWLYETIFPVAPKLSRPTSGCQIPNEDTVTLVQHRTPDFTVIVVSLAPLSAFLCISCRNLICLLHLLFPSFNIFLQ